MKTSDIAYFKQIQSGLKAVVDANKEAVKIMLEPNIEALNTITKSKEVASFNTLNELEHGSAVRLQSTKLVIFKDRSGMMIPIEIKSPETLEDLESLKRDSRFEPAYKYKAKSKGDLIRGIKETIKGTDGLTKELKASGQSMTKILAIPDIHEQNEVLKQFGVYDMDNILEHFHVQTSTRYTVTKELYSKDWITDSLTRQIEKDYNDVKQILIVGGISSSEVLAKTQKLEKEIGKILENHPLDHYFKVDRASANFFRPSLINEFESKQIVGSDNYNSTFHTMGIDQKEAIKIIKQEHLQNEFPILKTLTLNIHQPSKTAESLAFVLTDYINYQAKMRNEYKMMMQAQEAERERLYQYTPSMKMKLGAH